MLGERPVDEESYRRAIARTSTLVGYVVFAVGFASVLAAKEWALLWKILEDFPGWRSLVLVVALVALILAIPAFSRWAAARITNLRFGP